MACLAFLDCHLDMPEVVAFQAYLAFPGCHLGRMVVEVAFLAFQDVVLGSQLEGAACLAFQDYHGD